MLDRNWMIMHGYDDNVKPIEIDENYRLIIKYLKEYLCLSNYSNQFSLKTNISNTKNFFNRTLKLNQVPRMNSDKLMKKFDDKFDDINGLSAALVKDVKKAHPFSIPISYVKDSEFGSFLEENLLMIDDEEYLRNVPIIFDHINLSSMIPDVTGALYAHEIIHTQLNSKKGIVSDYLNSEVLSIFIELLTACNNDKSGKLLNYMINSRLIDLYKSLNEIDNCENNVYVLSDDNDILLDNSKYVVSILKALDLFNLYRLLDNKEKRIMLIAFQRVIDGRRTLEEQLDMYSISGNQSVGLIKTFI